VPPGRPVAGPGRGEAARDLEGLAAGAHRLGRRLHEYGAALGDRPERAAEEQALFALIQAPQLRGWNPGTRCISWAWPQYNRLYGPQVLTHDEWLYSQFERIKGRPIA